METTQILICKEVGANESVSSYSIISMSSTAKVFHSIMTRDLPRSSFCNHKREMDDKPYYVIRD